MNKFKDVMDNILSEIDKGSKFVLTSHVSPDGDNLGSTLAMYRFLNKTGKNVYYVLDDDIPSGLLFLAENIEKLSSSQFDDSNYIFISLDCGDIGRVCVSEEIIKNAEKRICIDHHASNKGDFSDINYIDVDASSTCELVFNLLRRYEENMKTEIIDSETATLLYAGLLTDTGNFQYSNTHPSSFEMAKVLLERNADRDRVVQKIYQSNSFAYYRILGDALGTLEITDSKVENARVASITVSIDMMKKHGIGYNEIDSITPYTRDIENVEVGIFLKERKPGEIKISLRSKNFVDVSKIAAAFNGGGHVRAAGCTINDSIENARKIITDYVLNSF